MAIFLILIGITIRLINHFDYLPIVAAISQYIPHWANFTPIAAIALFGSVYLNKKYALILPILAMFISDLFIGFYNPWVMASVYASFLLIALAGLWLRKHKNLGNILGASLMGSIAFFIITNFAVWAIPYSIYPHTLQGLLNSYTMGLPFFRNTLLGDLFYTTLFFGVYELVYFIKSKSHHNLALK